MTFVPNPQADQDERRMPIRLRVLAADSQLGFFPSDFRVDSARHASNDPLPPSKPDRPHKGIESPVHCIRSAAATFDHLEVI